MTDVEMKDTSKEVKDQETEKKEEVDQEPQDHFYGKRLASLKV